MYLYRKLEQKNCFRIFAVAKPRWTAPSSPKWTRYGRASAMTTNWYMSNYLQMYSLNLFFPTLQYILCATLLSQVQCLDGMRDCASSQNITKAKAQVLNGRLGILHK